MDKPEPADEPTEPVALGTDDIDLLLASWRFDDPEDLYESDDPEGFGPAVGAAYVTWLRATAHLVDAFRANVDDGYAQALDTMDLTLENLPEPESLGTAGVEVRLLTAEDVIALESGLGDVRPAS